MSNHERCSKTEASPRHPVLWTVYVLEWLALPASFLDAPYPEELLLQHAPTVAGLLLLGFLHVRYRLHPLSFGCALGFWALHIIGARWIYSFVPYDEWTRSLMGRSLSETFDWQRNHYDRLVHFASGLLGAPPSWEFLNRIGLRPIAAAWISVALVLAAGAVYEIVEWQIAVRMSPETAESYNGQQGDIWDPQKDMALALLGALMAVVAHNTLELLHRRRPSTR